MKFTFGYLKIEPFLLTNKILRFLGGLVRRVFLVTSLGERLGTAKPYSSPPIRNESVIVQLV